LDDDARSAPDVTELRKALDAGPIGMEMHSFISDLYPICRSITGNGVRETLAKIRARIPLDIREIESGTPVFDWTVPKEWNVRDAFIKNSSGVRVVDFAESNLHLVGYSTPVHTKMSLAELKEHLFTLPDRRDWIPYRTSYYDDSWGFCLSHNQLEELEEDEYEVKIDATLEDGHLTFGECFLQGESSDEILFSCHSCHPSLANDNLSGIAVATFLAAHLVGADLRYSYRFLFIPGTIGSITWLALNEPMTARIKHGLVLACVGDPGHSTYKRSRRGSAEIDDAVTHVLEGSGHDFEIEDFEPYGYDERQFCSPGFNLPVGCLMRTKHGRFPEYHTSADNTSFVKPEYLADTFSKCLSVLEILEKNKRFVNQNAKGEPQLGKRGLYRAIGGQADSKSKEMAMLWVLNLSDGEHSLLDIAKRSSLDFGPISEAADRLLEHDLLKEVL
jgi:aminopeptidase-like protein